MSSAANTNGNGRYTVEQMITALRATKGMVYLAAKRLGCSHTTVYTYLERHPTVRRAKEAEDGNFGDMCELKLYDAANRGESWAVQFALRTKFKNRGYVERQEITGAEGGDVEFRITYADSDKS